MDARDVLQVGTSINIKRTDGERLAFFSTPFGVGFGENVRFSLVGVRGVFPYPVARGVGC